MKKLQYHIANADTSMDKYISQIENAIDMAEEYAVQKLKPKDGIDIVFNNIGQNTIPEIHIGGRTHNSSYITISLDIDSEKINTGDIFQMLCHELCHAIRWQYNDEWSSSLIDAMIFEGLATAFEEESAKDNNMSLEFFVKTISERPDSVNQEILQILSGQLNSENFDYDKIFYDGDDKLGLPRWSGYSAGYYLVKKYMLEKNKKTSEIFTDKYADFK